MGKHKRKSQNIGRKFKHCRDGLCSQRRQPCKQSHTNIVLEPLLENKYASVSIPTSACNQVVSCAYTGNFEGCNCVVHHVHDDDHCVEVNDDADEYWLVLGSTMIKLESEDDIDRETYQQLRMDCETNEKLLSSIGFAVMKTASDLTLIQFYEKRFFSTKMAIIVDKEFNLFVTVHNKRLSENHPIFARTKTIYVLNDLVMFLKKFEKFVICIGNHDIPYDMPQRNCYVEHDHGAVYSQTIRVNQCTLLTDRTNRCSYCSNFRGTLQRANRRRKSCEVSLSSNRPNSTMTKEYLIKKAKMLKKQCESVESKNKRLLLEIDRKSKNNEMTEDTNWDISGLVHEGTSTLEEVFPDRESFQRLFWEEQLKFKLKDKRKMRSHPLIVKCETQAS